MFGSSETDLMSQRFQRMSGKVMALTPSSAIFAGCGRARRDVMTTWVFGCAGKAWSRGATPRVIWM